MSVPPPYRALANILRPNISDDLFIYILLQKLTSLVSLAAMETTIRQEQATTMILDTPYREHGLRFDEIELKIKAVFALHTFDFEGFSRLVWENIHFYEPFDEKRFLIQCAIEGDDSGFLAPVLTKHLENPVQIDENPDGSHISQLWDAMLDREEPNQGLQHGMFPGFARSVRAALATELPTEDEQDDVIYYVLLEYHRIAMHVADTWAYFRHRELLHYPSDRAILFVMYYARHDWWWRIRDPLSPIPRAAKEHLSKMRYEGNFRMFERIFFDQIYSGTTSPASLNYRAHLWLHNELRQLDPSGRAARAFNRARQRHGNYPAFPGHYPELARMEATDGHYSLEEFEGAPSRFRDITDGIEHPRIQTIRPNLMDFHEDHIVNQFFDDPEEQVEQDNPEGPWVYESDNDDDILLLIDPAAGNAPEPALEAYGPLHNAATYTHALPVQEEGMQCCFCLDEYQIGAELLVCLNVCEHSFHSSCLQDWLNTTHPGQVFVVCPLCRREICVAREMRLARTVPQA